MQGGGLEFDDMFIIDGFGGIVWADVGEAFGVVGCGDGELEVVGVGAGRDEAVEVGAVGEVGGIAYCECADGLLGGGVGGEEVGPEGCGVSSFFDEGEPVD